MKRLKQAFGWKQGLAATAVLLLLFAAGCGAKAEETAAVTPPPPVVSDAPTDAPVSAAAEMSDAVEPDPTPEPTEKSPKPTQKVAGEITPEMERLNRFLTGFVQQDIENTETDLDEDAELVRFAFGYLRTNDPASILEEEAGEDCRVLTLEQVNETLTRLLGRTLTPDREDYSILSDDGEGFHCVFRDGCFRNLAPYPAEEFSFPLRFALVERIDEESCTLYFRLYRVNPYAWGEGEAERHISILPMMSFLDAERGKGETKNWIIKLGTGKAILRDLGEELVLESMEVTLYH